MTQLLPAQQKIANVRALLERSKAQIALALPRHMDADRILRIAMTSVQRVPKLLDCDPVSLVGAVIQSSQLGLEPDGVLGHAYLIPYKQTVQFQPGYKGLLALARRSGEIGSVETRVVYEQDRFDYAFGLTPSLNHVPSRAADPGPLAYVYAIVRLKDGGLQWDVMSRAQIDAHRRRYSRTVGTDTPWETAYDEMAKKTVLKRVLKLAPASVELQRAIALDERAEAGLSQDLTSIAVEVPEAPETPATATESPSKLDGLTAQLAEEKPAPEPQPEPQPEPAPAEAPTERADLLTAIVAAVGQWSRPPSPALWAAVCREFAQTEDLEQADPAVLADLLAFVTACHRGEKTATLKLAQLSRKVRMPGAAQQQPDLPE